MREYVRPMALVEEFVANRYVAACTNSISKGNQMRCINPRHTHNDIFGSVWVEAASTTCTIIVDSNSKKTEWNWLGYGNPEENTYVYAADGKAYQCTEKNLGVGRWVPSFVNDEGRDSQCYGAYIHDGTYTEEVLS